MVPKSPTVTPEPTSMVMAYTMVQGDLLKSVGSVVKAPVLAQPIFVVSDGFPNALKEGLATAMVCPASSQSMVSADPSVSPKDSISLTVEEASVKTNQKPSPVKGMLRQGFFGLRTVAPSPPKVKRRPR